MKALALLLAVLAIGLNGCEADADAAPATKFERTHVHEGNGLAAASFGFAIHGVASDSTPAPSPDVNPSPAVGSPCDYCYGTGIVGDGTIKEMCLKCEGTGKVLASAAPFFKQASSPTVAKRKMISLDKYGHHTAWYYEDEPETHYIRQPGGKVYRRTGAVTEAWNGKEWKALPKRTSSVVVRKSTKAATACQCGPSCVCRLTTEKKVAEKDTAPAESAPAVSSTTARSVAQAPRPASQRTVSAHPPTRRTYTTPRSKYTYRPLYGLQPYWMPQQSCPGGRCMSRSSCSTGRCR